MNNKKTFYHNISDSIRIKISINSDNESTINLTTEELIITDVRERWIEDDIGVARIWYSDLDGFIEALNRVKKIMILK